MDKKIQKRKAIDILHDIAKRHAIIDMALTAGNIERVREELSLNRDDWDRVYQMVTTKKRRGEN